MRKNQEAGPTKTEIDAADRFVREHGHELRHCPRLGGWLVWTGTHWQADDKGTARERAKGVARAVHSEAFGDPTASRLAQKLASAHGIGAILSLACTAPEIARSPEDFDRDPCALVTLSGTVDLRTGELRASQPEDHNTRCVPHRYDPTAEAPGFARFFQRIQPDPEVRDYLCRWFGYAASGAICEHVLPVWHGAGANGKSTLIETIAAVLGPYAIACPDAFFAERKHEQHPTEIARLRAVRLAVASETRAGCVLDEAKVKKLTGGDRLTGRFMREDFFDFEPTAKFVLLTNHKPQLRGADGGIRRRVVLVPFEVVVPRDEQDPTLRERILANEAPGVLRMIVEGARRFHEAGERLEPPAQIRAATDDYHADQDLLGRFLAECCEVRPADERPARVRATPTEIYGRLVAWARKQGERAVPSQRQVSEQLREMGFEAQKSNGVRCYLGIGLRSTEGDERDARVASAGDVHPRGYGGKQAVPTLATLGQRVEVGAVDFAAGEEA